MKKHFAMFIILLTLITAISLMTVAKFSYSVPSIRREPFAQLEKSIRKTASILRQDILFSVPADISQALHSGAVDFSFTGANDTAISGRLYLREDALALIDANAQQGEPSQGFSFWLTRKDIAIQLRQGEKQEAYGLNLLTLANDLRGSELLTVAGISYEEIRPYLDAMLSQNEDENTDLRALLETRTAVMELFSGSSVSVSKTAVSMDIGVIDTYRVSLGLTAAKLCDAVDIYLEWFESTSAYQNLQRSDPEKLQELNKTAEALKQEITDTNASVMIDLYLDTKTEVILRASLRIDRLAGQQAATFHATIDLGGNPEHSELYSITIGIEDPQEGRHSYTAEYQRKNTYNLPTRKLIFSSKEESITVFDLQKNEFADTFDLLLMDGEYEIHGVSVMENQTRTIRLDLGGAETLRLAFILDAEIPEVPAYRNLCFVPRSELEEILQIPGADPDIETAPGHGCCVTLLVVGADHIASKQAYTICDTLGQLLVEEGVAVLDEQGRISKILANSPLFNLPDGETELAGAPWLLFVNDRLYEGSLYDVALDTDILISIYASGSVS